MMTWKIEQGDCLEVLKGMESESVHCCITSPPYFGLRDYGVDGQVGLEESPEEFVAKMVEVFREVKRVLRDDGTLWLNLGDSYYNYRPGKGQGLAKQTVSNTDQDLPQTCARRGNKLQGLKEKDLIGIPWMVAFALRADGWHLRQDIIWNKSNPMPESVTDRCTKCHEYIFLLTKSPKYFYDAEAIKEDVICADPDHPNYRKNGKSDKRTNNRVSAGGQPGFGDSKWHQPAKRNKRSVWSVNARPFKEAHFATFPPDLIEPCILAGCPPRGKRCDCEEIISTPTGTVEYEDDSFSVGRAGFARKRGSNEGVRRITRREQRHHAMEMKSSPHFDEMRKICGSAFDHYIRTDRSGARPLPESIRVRFLDLGWITESTKCDCAEEDAGVVLDPFSGAGTTGVVAVKNGRSYVGIELNPEYVEMSRKRLEKATRQGDLFMAMVEEAHDG